ncbi:hypothetical protein JB92DRAFT_2929266 [Gautieria morchelliformis]|nr:hypothetical protein JB92DRAFT_2929266 [Gautieria morchelliformis]
MDPYHPVSPLAGPSNIPPAIFAPPQPLPRPKQHLHSTQDLLSVFNLHPAYDKYVRPHVHPIGDPDPGKGKGKEKEVSSGDASRQNREADEEDGGEKKKKKDSYRHLIKHTPGKHSTKRDSYLQTLITLPVKQKMQIQPVDAKTLHEGFSVTLTGLPSYNKASLEGTDPKEKEAKRLKKERRKAEKEERLRLQQQQQSVSSASTPGGTSTPRAMATPGASGSLIRNVSAHTPTKVKSSINARPSPTRPNTPKVSASIAQQRTASTPVPQHQPGAPAIARITSHPAQVNGSAAGSGNGLAEKRGVKRELDAQPLSANAQPRPQKKRRMGSGTPQPAPLQQPTPRGS